MKMSLRGRRSPARSNLLIQRETASQRTLAATYVVQEERGRLMESVLARVALCPPSRPCEAPTERSEVGSP